MKRKFKIALDVIMLLMMLTLFSKRLISMQYHEIAGLVLIAVVIVHIAVNIGIARAMCRSFMKIPAALKAGLITDILLLLCFALLGVSGVLISHTILTGISSDNMFFKLSHMFAGGLSVILLGVHIGLHICRKPLPAAAAVVLSVIALVGGIYGTANSNEVRWLSMPFMAVQQPGGNGQGAGNGEKNMAEHQPGGYGQSAEAGEKRMEGSQNGAHGQNQGQGAGKNRQSLSPTQKAQNVLMFFCMILLCAMITYWIAVPKKKKSEKQQEELGHMRFLESG